MLYEIINPFDPYTLESDDEAAACIGVAYISTAYGLEQCDNRRSVMPMLAFGGNPKQWFNERFGVPFAELAKTKAPAVAAALDSVVIGNAGARRLFQAALDAIPAGSAREKFAVTWHDEKRSSLIDIGKAAKSAAKVFRQLAEKWRPLMVLTGYDAWKTTEADPEHYCAVMDHEHCDICGACAECSGCGHSSEQQDTEELREMVQRHGWVWFSRVVRELAKEPTEAR